MGPIPWDSYIARSTGSNYYSILQMRTLSLSRVSYIAQGLPSLCCFKNDTQTPATCQAVGQSLVDSDEQNGNGSFPGGGEGEGTVSEGK